MKISICVGSSCHLKGSYDVIQKLEELIKNYNLEDKITLQASFCLGKCSEGVTAKVDDEFWLNLNKENVEERFLNEVYPKIKEV